MNERIVEFELSAFEMQLVLMCKEVSRTCKDIHTALAHLGKGKTYNYISTKVSGLRSNGWLRVYRKIGRSVYYKATPEGIDRIMSFLLAESSKDVIGGGVANKKLCEYVK